MWNIHSFQEVIWYREKNFKTISYYCTALLLFNITFIYSSREGNRSSTIYKSILLFCELFTSYFFKNKSDHSLKRFIKVSLNGLENYYWELKKSNEK